MKLNVNLMEGDRLPIPVVTVRTGITEQVQYGFGPKRPGFHSTVFTGI